MEKEIYAPEPTKSEEEKATKTRTNLREKFILLSSQLYEILAATQHNIVDEGSAEMKYALECLLPAKDGKWLDKDTPETQDITNFFLCCAALASADADAGSMMSWIPKDLSAFAVKAIMDLSETLYSGPEQNLIQVSASHRISYHDNGLDLTKITYDRRLVLELMPIAMPMLKDAIKSTCSNYKDDDLDSSLPSASKSSAVIASHQMRWCLKQVKHPYLGPSCALVIPCALTALDHWSPEVKVQAISTFVHLAKNLNSAELGWYKDAILDASCRNIPGSERFWQSIVEMAVTLVICIEGRNPRAYWFPLLLVSTRNLVNATFAERVLELANVVNNLSIKVNDIASGPSAPKTKCEFKVFDGLRSSEVLDSWILDIENWSKCTKIDATDKVLFTKMKLSGVAKVFTTDRLATHNPLNFWSELVIALNEAFYPLHYVRELKCQSKTTFIGSIA